MEHLAYNLVLPLVWLAGLAAMRRGGSLARLLLALALAASLATLLGIFVLGWGIFEAMRVLAWAIFLHLPLALLGAAAIDRRRRAWSVAAALLVLAVGIDAFLVEPRWLEITRYELQSPKIGRPVRVALVADLQTDDVGEHERRALAAVAAADPDLVVFAGDYLQIHPSEFDEQAALLRPMLAALDPPLGAFAVSGDVDSSRWPEIFSGTRVRALGESQTLDLGPLTLTALTVGHSRSGSPPVPMTGELHVVVGHSPDYALARPPADLLLAGHTHGGQVRLPLIGPLLTLSRVPRSWAAGATDLSWDAWLVVSRGVGMERGEAPRLRFLCRPEIVILDIVPGSVASLAAR